MAQIAERGYRVAEISEQLGVSQHSLYSWKKQFGKVASGDAAEAAEIRHLKRDLARMTGERDILKNRRRLSPPVRGRNGSCYGAAGRVAADGLLEA